MAYPIGLGAGVPISQFLRRSPGVASMTPGFVVPAALTPGARTGPSNEDVLRHVFGSVEKGRAAQAASIVEAQQRSEQIPPMLAPHDVRQHTPAPSPIEAVEYEEEESDGEVIEEVAEGTEEGDSEFSGWGIGMGERPVGVTNTLREVARMDHVRRRQRSMKRGGLAKLSGKMAAATLRQRPQMGVLKARKKMIRVIPKPGVNIWRT